jgi:hypothetical protein
MENDALIPAPKTLADRLRDIPVGASAFYPQLEHSDTSVRSTLTRLKRMDPERKYTTRPEGEGLRVWRLA